MFSLNKLLTVAKEIICPIEKEEMRLFIPMALMMLCMLFNFGALRSLKDSLVVPAIGAEAISFLKLWLVLPASVLFTIFYAKLSNLFNFERVFYIVITIFLVFFLFFAYAIYPNQGAYHPDPQKIYDLSLAYPNFKWPIQIVGNWSYIIMYVCSELWSVGVINLMFWQFANYIFDLEQAKRFYPVLGMVGNIGLIIAGNLLVTLADIEAQYQLNIAATHQVPCKRLLQFMTLSIALAGSLAMALFKIINSVILVNNNFHKKFQRVTEESKTKLSLRESFKLVTSSRYIGHIVVLVLCYGLVINILEGPWKAKIREYHPSIIEYASFMGRFNIWMGVASVISMVIGSNILRNLSWLKAALFTPTIIFITGMIFFVFMVFTTEISSLHIGIDPTYAAVIIGALQNILSKSTKYSLFDSTKEMTYMPLPVELRTKGKATVEVIGLKFGKSLGALVQSSIFMIMPTADFNSIAFYLMIVFIIFIITWIFNVISLNKEYLCLCKKEKR